MQMEKTFTLAHLSDFHLFSQHRVKARDLLNKRILGYLGWRLHRRSEHSPGVLEALLGDLQITRPDHIVVTGDLTHLALPAEFLDARNILHAIGLPSKITVIPGNHDTYVHSDWSNSFGVLADFIISDEPYRDAAAGASRHSAFPSLRVRGAIALIGISSARPSGPLSAVGTIGQEQLLEMEKILEEANKQRLFRIILIHHPPVSGTVCWRKRLTDAEAFRSILRHRGVELVLHGHTHLSSFRYVETPAGSVPAIGVPSASALGHKPRRRARYHLYRLKKNPRGWEVAVSVRCYSQSSESFFEETKSNIFLPRPAV